MMLFDSHTHLLDERFDEDREEVVQTLEENGVESVVECATEPEEFAKTLVFAEAHKNVFCALGVHPHTASLYTPEVRKTLLRLAKTQKVVAIGEIGLDYHYDFSPREAQKSAFADQLALAREADLPVIVHAREATEDVLEILSRFAPLPGVMHCFSGSLETAQIVLGFGMHLGFGGSLTFRNARKLLEVAAKAPSEKLLIETDCPYLTPEPLRGQRNEPKYTALVAKRLAEVRGVSEAEMIAQTNANAKRLFRIE